MFRLLLSHCQALYSYIQEKKVSLQSEWFTTFCASVVEHRVVVLVCGVHVCV